LSVQEAKALIGLKRDDSVVVLPADKGRATVVMDRIVYEEKLDNLLSGGEYAPLSKNPTSSIENKVKAVLRENKCYFSKQQLFEISPQFSKSPHLYGLPKLHKDNIPLRPIVSSIDSPTYRLSKYILPILTPLFGDSFSYIKNSGDFLEKLKDIQIVHSNVMVSYDVKSLFTNVPVAEMLTIVKGKLESDNGLKERTKMPVGTIMELLTVCVENSYFQVNDKFYQQSSGLPMGGVLSPLLSNIYMDFFEQLALSSFDKTPKCWFRYLDDIFCIWEDDRQPHIFLDHINNLRTSIQFTLELENSDSLPFLDVLVFKVGDSLHTKVYKKPTSTGQYLNYNSNHSESVKLALVQGLFSRAIRYTSREVDQETEIEAVFREMKSNGYPMHVLNKALKKAKESLINTDQETPLTTVVIPYIKGLSEKMRRINNKFRIRTAFKNNKTIRSVVTGLRPNNSEYKTKNAVYKIGCSCGRNYYGQTSRPTLVRMNEHRKLLSKGEQKNSKLVEHSIMENHKIEWGSTGIIFKEPNWKRRNVLEAACMAVDDNCISQPSASFHPMFVPVVEKEIKRKINRAATIEPPPPAADKENNPPDRSVAVRRSERLYAKYHRRR
jgi:hypothetical protein